jgi:uncharacterized membrane protein
MMNMYPSKVIMNVHVLVMITCVHYEHRKLVLIAEVRSEVQSQSHPNEVPLIAFEHLILRQVQLGIMWYLGYW